MSEVSRAVTDRLKELDWDQKQLAHEWHKKVGTGSVSSFETHGVSGLVNDDERGFAFVLDHGADSAERLRVLAKWLKWKPEDLRAKCEAARTRPTLVLDPRLPEVQIAFFKKRETMFPDKLRCIEPNGAATDGKPRDVLRDLAKKSGPNAIVVVADDKDNEFFAGADVLISRVRFTRPCFALVALPDLTPQLPPRLRDDDGMLMMPSSDTEAVYRKKIEELSERSRHWERPMSLDERDKPWVDRVKQADHEGTPVTFRVDWLLKSWGPPPTAASLERLALAMAMPAKENERTSHGEKPEAAAFVWVHAGSGSASPTDERLKPEAAAFVWVHEGRVLTLCALDDDRRMRVAEHHPVHDVASFEPLVAALRRIGEQLNPYAKGGSFDLSAELRAFAEETGIALTFNTTMIRERVAARHPAGSIAAGVAVRRSSEADARVHSVLDDVLGREIILPEGRASILFELELARHAPLIHVEAGSATMRVIANIAAGNLLHLDITQYPGEEAQPIRLWAEAEDRQLMRFGQENRVLDGGNVRLMLGRGFNKSLEGTVLRTVARRREEEADDAGRLYEDDDD